MARKPQECFEAIKQALLGDEKDSGVRKATESEIQAIVDELQNTRSRVFSSGEDLAGPSFKEKALEFLNEFRFQAAAARKQALENTIKNQKLLNFASQDALKGDPVEAITSKLVGGTTRLGVGVNDSVTRTMYDFRGKLMNNLLFGLKDAGVDSLLEKGLMDRDVMQEIYELRDGGSPGSTKNPEALKAARVIKAVNQDIVKTLQNSGSAIREADDYIRKTIHSRDKISQVSFEDWASEVAQRFDLDKSFGASDVTSGLRDIYDSILQGRYERDVQDGVSDRFVTTVGMSANLSKKTSRARTLIPNSGTDLYEYNVKFGDKNLIESTAAAITTASRDAALMYHLGTNPEAGFQAWKSRLAAINKEDPKAIAALEQNDKYLNQVYDTVRGVSDAPGTSMAAKVGQVARAIESTAKLGNVVFAKTNELTFAAANARAFNGRSLLQNASDLVSNWTAALSSTERELWSRRLGVYMDDVRGELYSMMGAEDSQPGTMAKLQRAYSNLTLMPQLSRASRIASAKLFATELADNAGSAFDQLPSRIRSGLQRFNIDAAEWEVIRTRGVEDVGADKAITPEAIRSIPSDFFGSDGEKAKFDAETHLLSYLGDAADVGSLTPGARQKAYLLRGTPDEGVGIVHRLIAQFKVVPLMMLNTTERVLMSNPETAPKSLKEAVLQGKGDLNGMAQFMIASTVMGYIANSSKDLAQGKAPKDPLDPKVFTESFVRGGAAGLYADFFFGEYNRQYGRTAADAALGPVLGQGADIVDLWAKARAGQAKAGDALRMIWNNVPGHNLFYTKAAFDYLFMNRLNETLNPGYLRRIDQRTRQNPGLFNQHQETYFGDSMLGGQ